MVRVAGTLRVGSAGALVLGAASLGGCDESSAPTPAASVVVSGAAASAETTAKPAASASAASDAGAADADAGFAHPKADTVGCPDGMVRVRGDYCKGLMHKCLKHHAEYENNKKNPTVSERCLEYRDPPTCVSKKKQKLDFCMDRYEYPNQVGELPRVLTSWREARVLCKRQGKRLCTEDEFNFACEGPKGLPQVYGFVRSDEYCNIDKPYRRPDHSKQMLTYDKCYEDAECKAEMDRLDQRHRIGERLSCVSWAGVVDMNGNINEWVELPGKDPPNRSGLKGGWWGPVRNRCRPTVTFHKEMDYGYEAGFRCCADVALSEQKDP